MIGFENTPQIEEMSNSDNKNDLFVKIAFFSTLAGASILFGFSTTLNKLRKSTPDTPDAVMYEEGVALARKALFRGSIYSICGFGVVAFASYRLFGRKMIDNFNSKAKNNDEKDIEYLQNLFKAPRSALVGANGEKASDKDGGDRNN